MRSRYAAYAMGKARYVMETTDPDSPLYERDVRAWRASILNMSRNMRFVGLEIFEAGEEGDGGWVHFRAGLRQGGKDASFEEHSLFRRDGAGQWLYSDRRDLE